MSVTVNYTDTFKLTLQQNVEYLSSWSPRSAVIDKLLEVKEHFEKNVVEHPLMYPTCQDLKAIGVHDIHQFSYKGFSMLYRVTHENEIHVLVILNDRQSILDTLYDHLIIYR